MSKLWISAGIEVTSPENVDKAKAAIQILIEETLKEPGCIKFEIYQQSENPHLFTLWECWDDDAALKKHFEMAHTKKYLSYDYTKLKYHERLTPIMEGQVSVEGAA